MVLDKEPVADVAAVAIDGQRLARDRFQNNQQIREIQEATEASVVALRAINAGQVWREDAQ
jgi:hypothetical protein